jgi:hypothetical protein
MFCHNVGGDGGGVDKIEWRVSEGEDGHLDKIDFSVWIDVTNRKIAKGIYFSSHEDKHEEQRTNCVIRRTRITQLVKYAMLFEGRRHITGLVESTYFAPTVIWY